MKISSMKGIDRWLGIPACWILRQWGRLRSDQEPERIDRILVIKFWGMGSMILALPVFQALRKAYPKAELGFATLARNREFLEVLKISDRQIYLELPAHPLGIFISILSFFQRLRKFRPQAVIDLEYLTRFSAIATFLSQAEKRVGFHSWDVWRGELHNVPVPFNPYWHASENFLNLARKLTGRDFPLKFEFTLPENPAAKKRLEEKLGSEKISPVDRLILINPNASTIALERRWPPEHFSRLMEMLLQQNLGKLILIGAPDEQEFGEGLRKSLKIPDLVLNLAGKISLEELIELIRKCELMITNDSGPLHIAEVLHAKTVSFFGPETPVLFGPLGEGHKVLYHAIDCSPCITVYNAKTVHCLRKVPECVAGISPEEAFAAVKEALGNTK